MNDYLTRHRISYRKLLIIDIIFFLLMCIYILSMGFKFKMEFYLLILLLTNLFYISKSSKAPFQLIFGLFILDYSYIFTIPVMYPSVRISGIGVYYNQMLLKYVLIQYMLGLLIITSMNVLFFRENSQRYLMDTLKNYSNKIDNISNQKVRQVIVIFSKILAFLSLIFINVGKQSSEIGGIPSLTIPFEYIFIFLILIKVYGKNSVINISFIHIICFLIMVKTSLFGGRIETIESLLLLYIFYYEKKINIKTIIILFVAGEIVMELVGASRIGGSGTLGTSKLFFDRQDPPLYVFSNEGDVVYSAMAMNGLIQNGTINHGQQLLSFLHMMVTQFAPIGRMFNDANLALYTASLTPILGGGLIFSQWYFWLGNLGIFIVAILIFITFKSAYSKRNPKTISISSIYALILFPRWFAYFPDYLIKVPFVLFIILTLINLFMNHKQNKKFGHSSKLVSYMKSRH